MECCYDDHDVLGNWAIMESILQVNASKLELVGSLLCNCNWIVMSGQGTSLITREL